MLKRIIDNYKEIDIVLDTNKDHRKYILAEDEINYITSIVKILEPFEFITSKLSSEKYCSLNRIVPAMCLLLNKTDTNIQDSQFASVFRSLIHNRIKFYNSKYQLLNDDELALAAFSNPKTKHFPHALQSEKNDLLIRAKQGIRDYWEKNKTKLSKPIVNKMVSQKEMSKSQNETERLNREYNLDNSDNDENNNTLDNGDLEKEIERYIRLPKDDETPVEEYWLNNSKAFPIIFDIFKEYHGAPAMSTASERVFSHCENQLWDRRNRINPEKFGKLMFIYENEDV